MLLLLAAPLASIFNFSLREGVLPTAWKSANIIPLSKTFIYLSHKLKVANDTDKAYKLRIGQGDALIFMRAAVMMHTFCLQSQKPFDGSFPHNCLTGPVNEEMRSFFNVVLRGRSALCGRDMVAGDANLDPSDKIACNISQLLIYNTIKGTHHTVKTPALRHSKERETLFLLYRGLRLHGYGRDKKQIGIDKYHGISVSYDRVMEVKRGVARAVCARSAQDGIVVPSNSRFNVFTTHDVHNIDSTAQGNFSMSEFHGYALSVTNHCSHENPCVKRSPITLNPSDTSIPKLPDSYVIQPESSLLKRMSLPQDSVSTKSDRWLT